MRQMRRRGPDDQQYQQWRNSSGRRCALVHSRLSIIDCEPRSNQPFTIGRKTIVFNGELYNYREIRAELVAGGFSPRTHSDTEILLAAIERLGWESLDRMEGMWALAVYDAQDGSLTLCRDRFGEKPLQFYRQGDDVYFGSQAKFVFELLGRRLPVDADHIRRFLVNGYKSLYKQSGATFFAGLEEVPPGTLVRFDRDGVPSRRRYWQPVAQIDPDMTYEQAVEGARQRLLRAVELRLRSDAPIAFCLSGGVDSNALASIARREFGYDVHGFTVVNTDARYEEQAIIQQVVRELGIRHTEIQLDTSDFLTKLSRLVDYHDAPVYTLSSYAGWLLMEAIAQRGYRVSVSGVAADELFTGYYDHHLQYLAEVHEQESLHQQALHGWQREVQPWVRNPYLSNPQLFIDDPNCRDHIYLHADRFAGRLVDPFGEPFTEARYTPGLLRNRMLNELFHEATPVILHEDDLNSMYHSIENRSPFLDRELFAFCNRIPTRHLVRDGHAKVVLRDAMRGIVPDVVLDNGRKVGFNAPIDAFLDLASPVARETILADGPIYDYVRRDAIEGLLDQQGFANSESKFLFYFLNCQMFLQQQIDAADEVPSGDARQALVATREAA
jgi:asparagine synthase (glutamine-hydrolysing)